MRIRRAALSAVLVIAAGCSPTTVSPSPSPAAASPERTPPASEDGNALLGAPWRAAPLPVDPNLVAAIEFVCKNPADTDLKAAIENVPVALVDARGESFVSLILADEHAAFECRVSVEVLGGVPTATIIEPPSRLLPDATRPIADDAIRIVSHNRVDEDAGSRTIAIGRVGSAAAGVTVRLNDGAEVETSSEDGWFMAWWPGADEPVAIDALNAQGVVIARADDAAAVLEGRVGPASWWLDPAMAPLSPEATTIPALITERACASGQPPGERVVAPEVFSSEDAVLATVWIRTQQGGHDCQGNPAVPLEIPLSEPVGNRRLLDGSEIPPRDASVPPG